MKTTPASEYAANPTALMQKLIQFDTTNPPGNEGECIAFIRELLSDAGVDSQVFAKAENRPNLIARLKGSGKSAPLLLYGHVDVVTTANQPWTYPPFEARIVDGYVWGRGTLDMKGPLTMFLAAFLRAKLQGFDLPGDVILNVLSDEEDGGDFGAKYMVEQHPEQFAGVKYALGEFGGFNISIAGKKFYPIMISEKQMCWMKLTVRGQGGHGSMPVRDGAMAKLGKVLGRLNGLRLPVHITPPARLMVSAMSKELDGLTGKILGQLLNPALTNRILDLLGEKGRIFEPLFHNTVSPTMLQASDKVNVIPGEVSVGLDGRMLPGFQPADFIRELRAVLGNEVDIEVVQSDPGPADPDMGLFDTLGSILKEADPAGSPIPLLLTAVTDGRFFSRLGIQTYGFTPMQLPEDFAFTSFVHAADERIPVEAAEFGTQAVEKALLRF